MQNANKSPLRRLIEKDSKFFYLYNLKTHSTNIVYNRLKFFALGPNDQLLELKINSFMQISRN